MCFKLMNERIKDFKWWHMSFVKLSVLAFALMIAKLWSGILALDWYWYLVFGIVLSIVPAWKLFKKD